MAETAEPASVDEREQVEAWRLHCLLEQDVPLPLAVEIAGSDVDLHEFARLCTQGCAAELAYRILN